MSWLSNIAGRAESFLNQMDQVAATSLQDVGIATPSPNKDVVKHSIDEQPPANTGLQYEPVAGTHPVSTPPPRKTFEKQPTTRDTRPNTVSGYPHSSTDSMSVRPSMGTRPSNDSLMSFLNSPSTKPKKVLKTTPTRPRSVNTGSQDKNREIVSQWTSKETRSSSATGWESIDTDSTTTEQSRDSYLPQSQTPPSNIPLSQTPPPSNISQHQTPSPPPPNIPVLDLNQSTSSVITSDNEILQTATDSDHESQTNTTSNPRSHDEPDSNSTSSLQTTLSQNITNINIPSDTLPSSKEHSKVHPDSHISKPKDPIPDSEFSVSSGLPSPVMSQPGRRVDESFVNELVNPTSVVELETQSDSVVSENISMLHKDGPSLQATISTLEAENLSLRREIGALSEELSVIRTRAVEDQKVEFKYKEEVRLLRDQCSKLEGHLRHMRSQEDDLTSALEARDSQIHVLRVRLEETDHTVDTLNKELKERELEKQRLIHDVGLSSSAQNQALESVNTQLRQVQALLTNEQESTASLKNELFERERQFNNEKKQLTEAFHQQQNETQQSHFQFNDAQKSLQKANTELQQIRREFEEYKLKATTVLQNKEKIITSLRSPDTGGVSSAHEAVLEEARAENQQLLTQIHLLKDQVSNLKEDVQNMEDQHGIEMEQTLQQVRLSEESLREERERHTNTSEDLTRLNEEIDRMKHEFVREKGVLASQLREKENEVLVLSTRIAATVGTDQSDSTRRELEGRLQELTESLIQKQTTLEMLSAEKNSLYLQLERTKAALKKAESTNTIRQTALQMETTGRQASSTSLRPMASILPTSNESSQSSRGLHRVRSTLDQMDRFGLQIGWVLKRYPWVRLMLLLYIIVLHFWVTFVLLTYKPEMHPHIDSDAL